MGQRRFVEQPLAQYTSKPLNETRNGHGMYVETEEASCGDLMRSTCCSSQLGSQFALRPPEERSLIALAMLQAACIRDLQLT